MPPPSDNQIEFQRYAEALLSDIDPCRLQIHQSAHMAYNYERVVHKNPRMHAYAAVCKRLGEHMARCETADEVAEQLYSAISHVFPNTEPSNLTFVSNVLFEWWRRH